MLRLTRDTTRENLDIYYGEQLGLRSLHVVGLSVLVVVRLARNPRIIEDGLCVKERFCLRR
jgi:hypothetical protein